MAKLDEIQFSLGPAGKYWPYSTKRRNTGLYDILRFGPSYPAPFEISSSTARGDQRSPHNDWWLVKGDGNPAGEFDTKSEALNMLQKQWWAALYNSTLLWKGVPLENQERMITLESVVPHWMYAGRYTNDFMEFIRDGIPQRVYPLWHEISKKALGKARQYEIGRISGPVEGWTWWEPELQREINRWRTRVGY